MGLCHPSTAMILSAPSTNEFGLPRPAMTVGEAGQTSNAILEDHFLRAEKFKTETM